MTVNKTSIPIQKSERLFCLSVSFTRHKHLIRIMLWLLIIDRSVVVPKIQNNIVYYRFGRIIHHALTQYPLVICGNVVNVKEVIKLQSKADRLRPRAKVAPTTCTIGDFPTVLAR